MGRWAPPRLISAQQSCVVAREPAPFGGAPHPRAGLGEPARSVVAPHPDGGREEPATSFFAPQQNVGRWAPPRTVVAPSSPHPDVGGGDPRWQVISRHPGVEVGEPGRPVLVRPSGVGPREPAPPVVNPHPDARRLETGCSVIVPHRVVRRGEPACPGYVLQPRLERVHPPCPDVQDPGVMLGELPRSVVMPPPEGVQGEPGPLVLPLHRGVGPGEPVPPVIAHRGMCRVIADRVVGQGDSGPLFVAPSSGVVREEGGLPFNVMYRGQGRVEPAPPVNKPHYGAGRGHPVRPVDVPATGLANVHPSPLVLAEPSGGGRRDAECLIVAPRDGVGLVELARPNTVPHPRVGEEVPVVLVPPHSLLIKSSMYTGSVRNRAAAVIAEHWLRASPHAPEAHAPRRRDHPPARPTSVTIGPVCVAVVRASLSMETGNEESRPPSTVHSLKEALSVASRAVWFVTLRAMQLKALLFLFSRANLCHKMLLVARTGGGKSHVIRMIGTMLRGIHVIIHPLLVLTADQMSKFTCASSAFGPVSAHNLDEQASSCGHFRDRLIEYLLAIPADTSRTVYLFASPHFLATHTGIRNALLKCARRNRTLRSITLDEAHLLAKQGASFRPKIRMLADTFFGPLSKEMSPRSKPWLVCTTATDSKNDHQRLETMTRTPFPKEYCCWCPQ